MRLLLTAVFGLLLALLASSALNAFLAHVEAAFKAAVQ